MQTVLIWLLRFYKAALSPLLPSACRFHPTCSDYMRQAVERYGAWRGALLGIKRLLKCHPWHPGGFDPVR
jgi:putative membrane protein insertion efficiency factor